MSVKLNQSQLEFKEGITTFFEGEFTPEVIKKIAFSDVLVSSELEQKFIELGFFGSFASESKGGLGLGAIELSILAIEAGRVLLPGYLPYQLLAGPFLLSKIISTKSLASLESALSKERVQGISEGRESVALALSQTAELKKSAAGEFSGQISFSSSDSKERLLLFGYGSELWLVDLESQKIIPERVKLLDGLRTAAKMTLRNSKALKLESSNHAALGLDELIYLVAASELAGISQKVVALTVSYVTTRKQFDVPVGGFQAVQHKLAEMQLYSEAQVALTEFAAWAVDNSPDQAKLALNSAMNFATEWAPWIVENAVQLHGGIGFTWEYELHLYLRRARTLTAILGRSSRNQCIVESATIV